MKKIYKKLFVIPIIVGIFFTTNYVQADLGFNQEPSVVNMGSQYNITATLNRPTTSSAYVLLAILDTNDDFEDSADGPFINFELVTLPFTVGPTMTVSFQTPNNPEGKFLQYFFMPQNVFAGQTQAFFNPSLVAQTQGVYLSTQWHFGGGETGDDGGDAGDPTTPPTPGGPNYDPNVTYPPLTNPLGMNFDIINFLDKLFTNFVKIAFPFLVIFMVYSGFLFVEARGNEEKLAHAKKNLFYVIIGALIVLGAYTLAHAIKGTVDQLSYFLSNIINLV